MKYKFRICRSNTPKLKISRHFTTWHVYELSINAVFRTILPLHDTSDSAIFEDKFLDNDVASLKSNWWMSITKGELISKFWSQSRVCFKRKIMAGVWISLVLKINIDKLNLKILSLNHGNIYMCGLF